jgi:hypothetical protein
MDARICSLFLEPYQPPLARSYLSKVDRSLAIRCTCCPEGAAASRSPRSNSRELERTDVAGKRREVLAIWFAAGTRLILAPDHQERKVIGLRGAGGKSS